MNTAHFRSATFLISALLLSAQFVTPPRAQQGQPRTPAPRNSTVDMRARDREMRDRSMALDRIGKDDKTVSELVEKLKSDFRRLQTIDNELMRDVSQSLDLDYARISESAGEMNQCAKRLRANMSILTAPDGEKDLKLQEAKDDGQLKQSLNRLDDAVSSFVNSMAVVDAKSGSKAATDLSSVIQLSDTVKKSAKKLSRRAEKKKRSS